MGQGWGSGREGEGRRAKREALRGLQMAAAGYASISTAQMGRRIVWTLVMGTWSPETSRSRNRSCEVEEEEREIKT